MNHDHETEAKRREAQSGKQRAQRIDPERLRKATLAKLIRAASRPGRPNRGIYAPMIMLIVATMISLSALGILTACANE
jgi:hypothetical protein